MISIFVAKKNADATFPLEAEAFFFCAGFYFGLFSPFGLRSFQTEAPLPRWSGHLCGGADTVEHSEEEMHLRAEAN